MPAIVAAAGDKASEHFLEFFAATIRNKNTRAAYVEAAAQFFRRCDEYQLRLGTIRPLHVSAYIESKALAAPSIKQHLAALHGLFNWLVVKQVVPDNAALFVKGRNSAARSASRRFWKQSRCGRSWVPLASRAM